MICNSEKEVSFRGSEATVGISCTAARFSETGINIVHFRLTMLISVKQYRSALLEIATSLPFGSSS